MLRPLKLVLLFIRVSILNVTAYRFELVTRLVMSLMHLGAELIVVWTIFHNVQTIKGWGVPHMLVLVGVYRIVAGGIRMSIVPNMRHLLEDIREGTLDFLLLKPVNAQFLASIRDFVVWRIADVILGTVVVVFGCVKLLGHVPLGPAITFVAMLAAGYAIVYSIWLMLATMGFWLVRIANIEMVFWNIFEAGRFPIVIYPYWIRWTLTFIVPLAFITTFPAAAMFGDTGLAQVRSPAPIPLVALLLAAVMLVVSNRFWHYGLRRYSGASA